MDDQTIRQSLASNEFAAFFKGEGGQSTRFAVAYLDDENRAIFNCQSNVVWLSRHSLDEHKVRHPEVTIEDYRVIPDIVQNSQVWHGTGTNRYLLLWICGKPYRAAIKTDAQRAEAWFLSLMINTKQKPPKGAVRIR